MTDRITHMLVLIDRNPARGEAGFVQGMLGWLRADGGRPYSELIDPETKIHVMIVGHQDFSESYIANMALVHFRAVWNRTPVLNEIIYQRFNGPEGNGTTIEQRTTEPKTAPASPVNQKEPEAKVEDAGNLVDAVHRGDCEAVAGLLSKGANPNTRERGGDPTDATVLMRAAEGGHTEIVKLLLEKGADIDATWNVGGTALQMIASKENNAQMVKLFIEKGANVNAADTYGQTPLSGAALYDRVENARLLLDSGANINAKKDDGTTVLMGAVQYGNTATVRLLLERGATVDASPRNRETEQLMALAKKPEIAALLMTAAREQFMKAGNAQASPAMIKQTAAVSRPPRPAVASPNVDRPGGKEQQASKWWQFWK